jgi:rhamnogalacturonan endolyase
MQLTGKARGAPVGVVSSTPTSGGSVTMQHRRRRRLRPAAGLAVGAMIAVGGTWAVQQQAGAVPAGCEVDYSITHVRQGGFGAHVRITNLDDAVSGWTLLWSFAGGETVTRAWNAEVTLGTAQVTAKSRASNGAVATGGTVSFGFNGSLPGSAQPTAPSSFTLNGAVCTSSTTTAGGTSAGTGSGTS